MNIKVKVDIGERYRVYEQKSLYPINFWNKVLDTPSEEIFTKFMENYEDN